MEKIRSWISGWKTHIVAAGIGVVVVLKSFEIEVPEEVWPILAAFGLSALRLGVQKLENKKTEPPS